MSTSSQSPSSSAACAPHIEKEADGSLLVRVPPGVASLARFSLETGQRTGLLPADYGLASFIVDAACERSCILAQERGLCHSRERYHVDDEPGFLTGEDGPHLPILVP